MGTKNSKTSREKRGGSATRSWESRHARQHVAPTCRGAHDGPVEEKRRFDPKGLVKSGLDRALNLQQPIAVANVERLRRVHPQKSPDELITYLNRVYLTAVTATGASAGAAAIIPNGVVQVPVAAVEMLTFLEASVLYTLSVAEVHGVDLEDVERRRLLVMSVLLGDTVASTVLEPLIEKTAPYWGKQLVKKTPMAVIDAANKVLGPRFITKYGEKAGTLVLAKQVPAGIGVGIGAAGNHIFGRFTIKAAKTILGPAPATWNSRDA